NLTFHLSAYNPDYPTYGYDEIVDASHPVPELEALLRRAMILHNQYPWDRAQTRLRAVGNVPEDEYVVVFRPRSEEVMQFIRRVKAGRATQPARPAPAESRRPVAPFPPVEVAKRFDVMPRLEALAVEEGEIACT